MKLAAFLPLLMLCLACAPAKQPLTLSATGFSQINPNIPGGAGHRAALKLAELNARQQLHEHLKMYHLDGDQPLEQLYTIDPFVHAVCDDTIRSARITDRAIKEDGSVAVKVELNMDLLAAMLGTSVTAPTTAPVQPAPAKETPARTSPAQPVPTPAAPAQTAPAQPIPPNTAPLAPRPAQVPATPSQTTPTEAAPGQAPATK